MKITSFFKISCVPVIVLSLNTACSGFEKYKPSEDRQQIQAERNKLSRLQAELEQRQREIEAAKEDLEKKVARYESDRAEWNQAREARELEISALANGIAEKTEHYEQLKSQLKETTEKIASEQDNIEKARAELAETKKSTENEIAILKTNTANEAKEKLALAEQSLQKVQAQQEDLNRRQQQLVKAEETNKATKKSLDDLSSALKTGEERLQTAVVQTREMFKRDGIQDEFDRVIGNKKMKFLVSIVGRGSQIYLDKIQNELKALNKVEPLHSTLTEKPANDESYVVDNRFIVEVETAAVREFRDQANLLLETENKNGASTASTSLFVVVRPIQRVRFGLELTAYGSKSVGFDKRTSNAILKLGQVRALESRIHQVDEVDLSNPSSYVFAHDVDGRKCKTVDLECLKVLKSSGFLKNKNILPIQDNAGSATTDISNQEALSELLQASMGQMQLDLKLFDKGLSLFSVDYSVAEDGFNWSMDFENLKKLKNVFFSAGETRAPVVDKLVLSYRVVMVDNIGHVGNHLDTWKYMTSGTIQNIQMFAADRARNEIEIQLPIKSLKSTEYSFRDLSLSDYAVKAKKKEFNGSQIAPGTTLRGINANIQQVEREHQKEVRREKVSEFKNRLVENIGVQSIFLNELKAK